MDIVSLDSENFCDEGLGMVMSSCNEGLEDQGQGSEAVSRGLRSG
jgi:hypothetical protein